MRAEIATIFGPNVVAISARNIKVYKIYEHGPLQNWL
jgi:hypothetical protein